MAQFNVVSSSIDGTYTGSIAKVLALGADDAECTLSNIDFGNMTNPEASFTPTSNIPTAIIIPAGSYVDGPIGRLKVDAGGFLIYFNN